ncbi:MAG: serine--tRNA ligase [Sphaerobacteraceae bacterium]|nr:MAG: serine--tRNA ligase [Sphaerobacteraceae bacterium]
MLDLRLIRENPDQVRDGIRRLNIEAPIDDILSLDEQRRSLLTRVEELKAQRNAGSKEIGKAADGEERNQKIAEMRALGDQIGEIDEDVRRVDERLGALLLEVPNMPDADVPDGPDESANVILRHWGDPKEPSDDIVPHWDLAADQGLIDFERGVKVSGSRFYFLRADMSRLQRALITWMIDIHTREHGYIELTPPVLVRSESMIGTGNLPKFGDTLYRDDESDLWLIPTSEVSVTNYHREELLEAGSLPIKYVAQSLCFRREQFSAGRDVRGIKRVHQFEKVEMVKLVEPEKSDEELYALLDNAEKILQKLELPYRVVQMCTGDLSFVSAKKIDLEVWAPGSEDWLEVSSCANFRDFQARRANIRYRAGEKGRPQYVHTLNGSGLALPRTMIAILENYQQPDGSVIVPEVLRNYMGGQELIEKQGGIW